MYLFNHMRELYETASPGSTEYILAQYILLNEGADNFLDQKRYGEIRR